MEQDLSALQNDYGGVNLVSIGKGYATVSPQKLPAGDVTEVFKHYIDIATIAAGLTDLRRMSYAMKEALVSDNLDIGSIRLNNVRDAMRVATITPTAVSSDPSYLPAKSYDADFIGSYYMSNAVPTFIKPENIMYKFNANQLLNKIRIYTQPIADYALENYRLQFTVDATALVTDDPDSLKWADLPGLKLASRLLPVSTGTITGGSVIGETLYNRYLEYDTIPFTALAVRFVIFKTVANVNVRICDVQMFTADDINNTELVVDQTGGISDLFNFDDYGGMGTVVAKTDLPKDNTTASNNIYYDFQNGLMRVLDKSKAGVIVTDKIDSELMLHFLLTTQVVQADPLLDKIEHYISNNDGETWTLVANLEFVQTLLVLGQKIRLKFVLHNNTKLSAYALLYSM